VVDHGLYTTILKRWEDGEKARRGGIDLVGFGDWGRRTFIWDMRSYMSGRDMPEMWVARASPAGWFAVMACVGAEERPEPTRRRCGRRPESYPCCETQARVCADFGGKGGPALGEKKKGPILDRFFPLNGFLLKICLEFLNGCKCLTRLCAGSLLFRFFYPLDFSVDHLHYI
jgi:hypothetical protein